MSERAMSEPLGPEPVGPGAGTTILEPEVVPDYRYDEGDHERFAHYADRDKIMESMVTGVPITALCGKVWVPSRDPKRFPVCPTCKEIYDGLPPGDGDGNGDEQ
ncbi:MAG TPA: DUF3039 domain-containing protein [Motilibacteraceae bacterium]|nr:DUF3039 domain-containing protein [Motilibacteraceae bacterium]